jgi:Galactose-3-O-sulfotransferase
VKAISDAIVVFIHMPKSAGATLCAILRSQYGEVPWLDREHLGEGASSLRGQCETPPRAIAGHMPYGLHDALGRPCDYLTLVRDPVERIESHYRWVLRHPESPHHAELVSAAMSLRDYAVAHSAARFFNDGQTRLLGGTWSDYRGAPTEATLEAAKCNLEEFAFVGLADRFDESVTIMRRRLGWRWPIYERRNVAPAEDRERTDEGTREAIARCNLLDAELCRWARVRLEGEIARGGRALADELDVLRRLNGRGPALVAAGGT